MMKRHGPRTSAQSLVEGLIRCVQWNQAQWEKRCQRGGSSEGKGEQPNHRVRSRVKGKKDITQGDVVLILQKKKKGWDQNCWRLGLTSLKEEYGDSLGMLQGKGMYKGTREPLLWARYCAKCFSVFSINSHKAYEIREAGLEKVNNLGRDTKLEPGFQPKSV